MIQHGDGANLAFEAVAEPFGGELEGYFAAHPGIARGIPRPCCPRRGAPGSFEEPPRRTFPFSRLRSRLFFDRDQFVA
jgi:hypothetical protein